MQCRPFAFVLCHLNKIRDMDSRLYEAAIRGNVTLLIVLLQEDPTILDRVEVGGVAKETPLHIAAQYGHVDFVREILRIKKPKFVSVLNSQGQSPLHLASTKGHVEVVKELLKTDSDVAVVRDRDGRTPLHIAAMKGRLDVLKELVTAKPMTAWVLTDKGEPILHLCANHDQFEAVEALAELVADTEFANLKDNDDNTILHLLAEKKQTKVIKFLVDRYTGLDFNTININGFTVMDLLLENLGRSDLCKIIGTLKRAGAKTVKEMSPTITRWRRKRTLNLQREKYDEWLSKKKETLLVAATLMAAVTFQAGTNPPGGVWQDNQPHDTMPHFAGQAIMSNVYTGNYRVFTVVNTIGFVASLSLIVLLISEFPFKRRLSVRVWALTIITWIAVTAIFMSYGYSLYFTSDQAFNDLDWLTKPLSPYGWIVFMGLLLAICFIPKMQQLHSECVSPHKYGLRSNGHIDGVDESRVDCNP